MTGRRVKTKPKAETIEETVVVDRDFAVTTETTQDVVAAIERLFNEAKDEMVARVLQERRTP